MRHAYLGIHGFKNTGLLARAMKDKKTGKWHIKMQGALDAADQDFFNIGNFDIGVVRYLVLGSFFEKHFSPFMGKGNVAGKFEVVSDKNEKNMQYTMEIGKQINPMIQVGGGVDILKSKGEKAKAGLAYELRANSGLGKGYNATAEVNGNTRTGDGGFWLNFSKSF